MSLSVVDSAPVEGSGYMHGLSPMSRGSADVYKEEDRKFFIEGKVVAPVPPPAAAAGGSTINNSKRKKQDQNKIVNSCDSSSSTSSIGKDSDLSGNSSDNLGDTEEVQSSYKGPLDSMEALEEVLPIRRGISRFYNGKSKSFASLAEASASSSSMKDLVKPENAYMRKRRNLLSCSLAWEKNRNFPLRSNGSGISKRVTNPSRTTLALAVAMANSAATNNTGNGCEISDTNNTNKTTRFSPLRPQKHRLDELSPLSPRQSFCSWRSFSLADLQQCDFVRSSCTSTTTTTTTQLDRKPS